jgi:hypothetical protein
MEQAVNFPGWVKGLLLPWILVAVSWLFGACWNASVAMYFGLRKMAWHEAIAALSLVCIIKTMAQVTKWFNRTAQEAD